MKLLKFTDGTDVYDDFNTVYKKHKKGYVILAPPGTGKTTFVNNQTGKKKDWIDVDSLFGNKSLNIEWMNTKNPIDERLSYLRADYMLEQSKLYGYRMIGALFWEYKADAIVIPPFKLHTLYVSSRKDLDITKIKTMRKIFFTHAKKYKIPVFDNIINAVTYLDNLEKERLKCSNV
jgi:hypothetical protein